MKKSILLGALAFFAVSALSIQNVSAQNLEVKQQTKKVAPINAMDKAPSSTTVAQEPVKQKKDDCCAEKKEVKKGDCCSEKAVKHENEKNVKHEGKKMKGEAKKDLKHHKHGTKPEGKMVKEQKKSEAVQK